MHFQLALHCIFAAEIVQHACNNRIAPKISALPCFCRINIKQKQTVFRHSFNNRLSHGPCLHNPDRAFVKAFIHIVNGFADCFKIPEPRLWWGPFMKRITGIIMICTEYSFLIFKKSGSKFRKQRINRVKLSCFRKIAPALLH